MKKLLLMFVIAAMASTTVFAQDRHDEHHMHKVHHRKHHKHHHHMVHHQ
jgi:hypothetical protein